MGFFQGCVTLSATHRKWISHLELLAISQLNHRHIPFTEKLWNPQLRLSHNPDNGRIEELAFSKKGKGLNICKSGPGERNFKGKANQAWENGSHSWKLPAAAVSDCPLEHCIHTSNHSSKAEKYNTVITSSRVSSSESHRCQCSHCKTLTLNSENCFKNVTTLPALRKCPLEITNWHY